MPTGRAHADADVYVCARAEPRSRRRFSRTVGVMVWVALTGAIQVFPCGAGEPQRLGGTTIGVSPWRGVVRAVNQAALSTDLVTPVAFVGAREGERFKVGDSLVTFDCKRQQHELSALSAIVRETQVTHESNAHLVRNGASNRNDVAIAHARMQKAAAEHAAMQQRLGGCQIVAPFDGVVVELNINVHELPQPNRPLMLIVSDRHLEIEIIVPSRELPRLASGVRFDFTVDETRRAYAAHVLRAGGAVDPVSQTAKIYATFSHAFDAVVPGMSGTALISFVEAR